MTREIWGIAAEFADPESLVDAAVNARDAGYRHVEAYTPYPIKQLEAAIPDRRALPPIVFIGGLLGFLTAWAMEFYIAVIDYPINVGGRPLNSWPSFIVIMFELTVLFASVFAFVGTLALSGFPRPNHPMFNLSRFSQVSNNRFFLCIEASDPIFDAKETADFLADMDPVEVMEVDED
ncbi:MAG: DUF3341 domain-containing protein [Acidobacteriia bacterium]|nr:DUF3341 domain-containing protein [Terriglobia bacterium]